MNWWIKVRLERRCRILRICPERNDVTTTTEALRDLLRWVGFGRVGRRGMGIRGSFFAEMLC